MRVRRPEWLKKRYPASGEIQELKKLLRKADLHTVCEEARCPNIGECFQKKTATFMILGDVCTRNCGFCSVRSDKPEMPPGLFSKEARRVADAVQALGIRHVVVTSVTRDDLLDGGASGFAETITAIREHSSAQSIEVLIPDFRGSLEALNTVLQACPDVLGHNLETINRLYPTVRPQADYERSLELLKTAKQLAPEVLTKTGIMLGLGEGSGEVIELMHEAKGAKVDIFTAGQYLQPSKEQLEVQEYITPQVFEWYREKAESIGFSHVFFGPFVRSSYRAEALWTQ